MPQGTFKRITRTHGRGASVTASISYTVPGRHFALAQEHSWSCWAATWAMLLSWREGRGIGEAQAVQRLGLHFSSLYQQNIGFGIEDEAPYLQASGLRAEAPANLTVQAWESLLRRSGPLAVTSRSERARGNHARVVVGIAGDGSFDATFLDLIDPADGIRASTSLRAFSADFEREARRLTGRSFPLQIQIYHW
jgi:hypothetical protein